MQTKVKTIEYWVTTSVVAAVFLGSGVFNALRPPPVLALMTHLGYPTYFPVLLGAWKVLGGLAILAPGLPRVKEWAYAGIFFELTSAVVSHAASGDGVGNILPPAIFAAVAVASWALRPSSRKLAGGPTVKVAATMPTTYRSAA